MVSEAGCNTLRIDCTFVNVWAYRGGESWAGIKHRDLQNVDKTASAKTSAIAQSLEIVVNVRMVRTNESSWLECIRLDVENIY